MEEDHYLVSLLGQLDNLTKKILKVEMQCRRNNNTYRLMRGESMRKILIGVLRIHYQSFSKMSTSKID